MADGVRDSAHVAGAVRDDCHVQLQLAALHAEVRPRSGNLLNAGNHRVRWVSGGAVDESKAKLLAGVFVNDAGELDLGRARAEGASAHGLRHAAMHLRGAHHACLECHALAATSLRAGPSQVTHMREAAHRRFTGLDRRAAVRAARAEAGRARVVVGAGLRHDVDPVPLLGHVAHRVIRGCRPLRVGHRDIALHARQIRVQSHVGVHDTVDEAATSTPCGAWLVHEVARLSDTTHGGATWPGAVAQLAVPGWIACVELGDKARGVDFRNAATRGIASVVPGARLAVVAKNIGCGLQRVEQRAHGVAVASPVTHDALVVGRQGWGGSDLGDHVALVVAVLAGQVSRVVEEAAALSAVSVAHGGVQHERSGVVPAINRVTGQVVGDKIVWAGHVAPSQRRSDVHTRYRQRASGSSFGIISGGVARMVKLHARDKFPVECTASSGDVRG